MKHLLCRLAVLLVAMWLAACAPPHARRTDVLFWNQPQREANFRAMETQYASNVVRHGKAHPLPKGAALAPRFDDGQTLDGYMADHHVAGIMVVQDGKVRLERYGLGADATTRWTSFSVAKSFTSTLVGAALRDGAIGSLDDPVTRYIPELVAGAYRDVTVRQLLSMTSGVRWNEDYADPHSDVAMMYEGERKTGVPLLVSYMSKLPREFPAGARWVYKTGETDLIGILVTRATGKSLAAYLAEKIWIPYGMAEDAIWLKDDVDGTEAGGSGVSATLADYARLGQFLLDGGVAAGEPVLAPGWLDAATRTQASIGSPGRGYGYQWWTYDDGSYEGIGIFGQLLHVDPRRHLVIVQLAAWPVATDDAHARDRAAFVQAVNRAVEAR
ncbi:MULTISPECIES: serine hydrolase [unclassified Luteibacter]|uniref:serine hydrolase domain-containing protein n=1 Tax=unclassified Luteibacter TaxID=2620188 RepID=UPI0008C00288|nr:MULTISPECIES: serine hydrolase [unclassified Luteibacter]MDR6937644.1 CubicO group peptidase (beta-lactamase class C family) [Luteibacter sp. 3190]SEO38178.1 CubicO group peptidase, beta-lactamase class C family [Luteibacter sp. UNC138MFCol5.1]